MKKILMILVAMAFIAFGFAAGASAAGMDKSTGKDAKDVSHMIGKDVKNPEGENLGEVRDFIRDENGEISLAILTHGGFMGVGEKDVAVPYSALSFNESEDHFLLNASKDQLAGAPDITGDENLNDRAFAEEVYRYFGERPYWTDEGAGAGTREYFGAEEDMDTGLEPEAGAGADLDSDIEMEREKSVEDF